MYCKHCNVEIEGNARVCPLCHKPLDGDDLAFPIIKKTKRKINVTFGLVYIIIALAVSVVCLAVNFLLPHKLLWSLTVIALLAYFFIVFQTVFSKRNAAVKIFLQILFLVLVAYGLEKLSPDVRWAANYAVPIIILLGGLLLMILSLAVKKAGPFILNLIFVAILGLLPVIYNLIVKTHVWIPTIICACGSGGMLLFAVLYGIFSEKGILKEEIKRKFHL